MRAQSRGIARASSDPWTGGVEGTSCSHQKDSISSRLPTYVTIKDGSPRPTSHDLIEYARARVGYKAPEEVVFLDEMPLNPTGKIDRVELKAMAEDHLHPHGLPA